MLTDILQSLVLILFVFWTGVMLALYLLFLRGGQRRRTRAGRDGRSRSRALHPKPVAGAGPEAEAPVRTAAAYSP